MSTFLFFSVKMECWVYINEKYKFWILANGCNETKSEHFKGVWILSVPTVYGAPLLCQLHRLFEIVWVPLKTSESHQYLLLIITILNYGSFVLQDPEGSAVVDEPQCPIFHNNPIICTKQLIIWLENATRWATFSAHYSESLLSIRTLMIIERHSYFFYVYYQLRVNMHVDESCIHTVAPIYM